MIEVPNREPLEAELDAFLAVAASGGQPVVDGVDGLWAVAIAITLLQSASETRPIDLAHVAARIAAN